LFRPDRIQSKERKSSRARIKPAHSEAKWKMNIIKTALAIVVSILLAASVVAPANAAIWYNPDTNQFEDRAASGNRGGSPIRKQIVEYETTHKPGTIIIETGERRLY